MAIVPPSALGNSQIQTLKQFTGFNQVLDVQPAGGTIILSGQTTVKSSFNVLGNTTLNNATTINSSLNVVGNIIGSGTALTNLNYNAVTNKPDLSGQAQI